MCSNETLRIMVAELRDDVKSQRVGQTQIKESLDRLLSAFETWQQTKCESHHARIGENKALAIRNQREIQQVSENLAKAVSKTAGIYGSLLVLIQIASLALVYFKVGG